MDGIPTKSISPDVKVKIILLDLNRNNGIHKIMEKQNSKTAKTTTINR